MSKGRANLVIGYKRLPRRKKGSVVIFVDLPRSKMHLINKVVFRVEDKTSKIRHCAKPTKIGSQRVQFFALFDTHEARARVIIYGCGRSAFRRNFKISSTSDGETLRPLSFRSQRTRNPMGPLPTFDDITFGIELEMSSAEHETASAVAASISSRSGVEVVDMKDNYRLAKKAHGTWRLAHDSSLLCNRSRPNCERWELVSRILKGEDGLSECEKVIKAAQAEASIKVNKSMGFHVHVGTTGFKIHQLINICKAFVRFEKAIDSFMPESRRGDNNDYAKSNLNVVGGKSATHDEKKEILQRCTSIEKLADVMNPEVGLGRRYFKLNLDNVRTGDKDTFEFRQHSATANSEKVKNFARFCVAFVQNSADLHGSPWDDDQDDEFEQLFKHIIKDRYLRDYYLHRRAELVNDVEEPEHILSSVPLCRLPATLTPSEQHGILRAISLEDRTAYFSRSTYPITKENDRLMEGISRAVTSESYGRNFWEQGIYHCARCKHNLYSSEDKWRAQCIWPTFRNPIANDSLTTILVPKGRYNEYRCETRELYCGSCHLFLGHQFFDGRENGDDHPRAGWRHCTLSLSLNFSSPRSY